MKLTGKILTLLMLSLLVGCKDENKTVPPVPQMVKVVPQLDENLSALGMRAVFPAENILELQGKGRVVKLVSGSAAAFIDGIPLQLPAPVTLSSENFWCIDPATVQNILLPLMGKRSFPIRKIVLDPGHGGHDKGAVSADGIMEKDLNLQLASAIAEELAYNAKYLSHAFKEKMQMTYSEYLRSLRIKYAISLFDHGIDSIKNVALLSGFIDPLYFSNVFKKSVGTSPKTYISNRVKK